MNSNPVIYLKHLPQNFLNFILTFELHVYFNSNNISILIRIKTQISDIDLTV